MNSNSILKNETGSLEVLFDGPIAAGEYCSIEFKFTPNTGIELRPRDCVEVVLFMRFSSNLWSVPQVTDPTAPGYVFAKRTDNKYLNTSIYREPEVCGRHGTMLHIIRAVIGESALANPESVRIIYGYRDTGSPGVQAPPLAREYVFPVFIGFRALPPLPDLPKIASLSALIAETGYPGVRETIEASTFCPSIAVVGSRPSGLQVVAPSVLPADKSLPISVRMVDQHGNTALGGDGQVELIMKSLSGETVGDINTLSTVNGKGVAHVACHTQSSVRVLALGSSINGISNPVKTAKAGSEKKVFWGEIHGHSALSDGLCSADDNYQSAIDVGLDFTGLADHDTSFVRSPKVWEMAKAVVDKYHKPGSFVTILGYEAFAMYSGKYAANINIYYPGDDGPMVNTPEISEIIRICKENNAIAIPHHTMYGDGDFFGLGATLKNLKEMDATVMPVVEIYSCHGSSEYYGNPKAPLGANAERSVQRALAMGFKWGIIAGSDNHETMIGHLLRTDRLPRTINNEHGAQRYGLTAVYAETLSRESILDAIRRREVYGTTGERILLRFALNGQPMGSEISINDKSSPRILEVEVIGTSIIEKVEVLRNNDVIYTSIPDSYEY